jgi:hypothetical protein
MESKEERVIGKIKSRQNEKRRIVILCLGILVTSLFVSVFVSDFTTHATRGITSRETISGVGLILMLIARLKYLTTHSGQFIEWTADEIIFKLKNETSELTIQRNQIKTINIHLDIIEVFDKQGQKFVLDISDFSNYDDRLKIKENLQNSLINTEN